MLDRPIAGPRLRFSAQAASIRSPHPRESPTQACQRNAFYEEPLGENESQQHWEGENKCGSHKVIEGREVEALVLLQP